MSLTTSGGSLSRQQKTQMPSLLEFHSPTAAIMEERPRGAARAVIWVVVATVASCGVAMAVVPIDKVVTAQGRVVVTNASIVVQPLETAIVRELGVQQGQMVHKGDLLARLDPTFSTSDKTSMTLQVESLTAEVERLRAEASGGEYQPSATNQPSLVQLAIFAQRREERMHKRENYAQRITALQAQLLKAVGDIQAFSQRVDVANTVEGKRRELERLGWGSQLNALQAKDQTLEVRRSMENAQQAARSAAGDLAAMRADAAGDEQDWKAKISQELTETSRKLIDAESAMQKAMLRSAMVELRASEDATVLTMANVSVGSVMQSGEKFITLVPRGAPLELEVALPGRDAGYVHLGDPVIIKFDTFPYTQYGGAKGQVRSVSPDSFTAQSDERTRSGVVNSPGSASSGSAYYRLNVSLDKIELHDTPTGFQVSPGMPVEADVMVGKRTMLSYILSRSLPVLSDGMREP